MEDKKNKFGIHHADIVVTHACNMNCPHCIDKFKNTSSQVVELAAIEEFLRVLKENTYKKIDSEIDNNPKIEILLLGGEPTLVGSEYLIKIANLVHSFGFEICISTNGTKKQIIEEIIPHFDWIQITCYTDEQIDFWSKYPDKVNIKIAGDENFTLEKFEHFIEKTKQFKRKSLSMYFAPEKGSLCNDENVYKLLNNLDWKRLGSYEYTFYEGVRIKQYIPGETNIIDEPMIPKLYPNGNYNKNWYNEKHVPYLGEVATNKSNFFDEYTKKCKRTTGHFNNIEEQVCSYGLGLCGESGEVVDHIKKIIFHGHSFDRDKLSEELGDLIWYIAMLLDVLELDLEDILDKNIEKLKKRYPSGFTCKDSIERTA